VLALSLCFFTLSVYAQTGEPDDTVGDEALLFEDAGITVTGTVETTQQMHSIGREDIEQSAARDVAALLQDVLGLNATNTGGAGDLSIHGYDGERIAFLVDGVPVNSALTGEADLSGLDLSSIEKIEVVYGGSDTKYNVSGAFGGVVNIVTIKENKKGATFSGSVSNTAQLPGNSRKWTGADDAPHYEDLVDAQHFDFGFGFGAEKLSASAGVFINRAGNHYLYRDTIFDYVRRKEGAELLDGGANVSGIYKLGDGTTRVIAKAGVHLVERNIPDSGYASDYQTQRQASGSETLMLDAPIIKDGVFQTEANLAHNWNNTEDNVGATSGNRRLQSLNTFSVANRWAYFASDAFTLRFGGGGALAALDSETAGTQQRGSADAFVTGELRVAKNILLITSVSGAFLFTEKFSAQPIPKIGILWKLSDALSAKANAYRTFKYPDFEDLYWSSTGFAGNPALKPEDGWGGDLGLGYNGASLTLNVTGYVSWTRDSIHWATQGGAWAPHNVGEALLAGADAKASYVFDLQKLLSPRVQSQSENAPVKKIRVSVLYHYLYTVLLYSNFTFKDDKRIPYSPEHTASAALEFLGSTYSLGLKLYYEGARYSDMANYSLLDDFLLLGANFTKDFGAHLTLFASLNNILNTSYETIASYPMPGASFTIGLKVKFL
jgi:vitamin B12 transporter